MSGTKSVAIVTGASQGIGRATALRLARDFSVIVLVARDEDKLEKTAADVVSLGAEATVFALDLRQPESAKTIIKGTLERFGRIDALLNIAGAVPQIDLFEMTDPQWDDGMALKLHGARRLTMQAWDALKASNGSVVLISGSAAFDPKPGFAAVAATNAAIIALAKAFAEQGIKDGIQVNSVSPGAVMTAELSRIASGEVDDRCICAHGRRRDQRHLGHGPGGSNGASFLTASLWTIPRVSSVSLVSGIMATPISNWLVGHKTNQANPGAMTFPRKLFVPALSKLTVI